MTPPGTESRPWLSMFARLSPAPAPVGFAAADEELADTLESLDGADNYADWILSLVAPHLGRATLELGAGHGTFTRRLMTRTDRLVAVDLSERCVQVLRDRFGASDTLHIVRGGIDEAGALGPYDAAVLINVLEHIEDDDAALRQLRSALGPGGRVVLFVPAFRMLYSRFDRLIGHHRRYRTSALRAQLVRCGYRPVDVRYVNAPGALGWLLVARLLRRTPTHGAPMRLFDRAIVPLARSLESRWRIPFGLSVFAVGERED